MNNMYPQAQHRREEVVRRCSVKLMVSKTSEENTEVFFNKDAELQCNFPAKIFIYDFH